jgi:MSHA biogenesis protein MshO
MIELVTVMALTGVLAVGLGNLLQHPLNGYAAVSRRAELVTLADIAVGRLARDLRQALPNSLRVAGSGDAIEFLHTVAGARYRLEPGINDPGGPGEVDHTHSNDWLSFGGDRRWNLLGRLTTPPFTYGTPLPSGTRIAIYPTGTGLWAEAAANTSPSVITPSTLSITITDDGDEDQIRLSADHRFPYESAARRLYLVDSPTTYLCDPTEAALFRIDGYPAAASQPTVRTSTPLSNGSSARMSDHVELCRFSYLPGTASRAGIVTIEIVLEDGGERVRLLQQVQIGNAP